MKNHDVSLAREGILVLLKRRSSVSKEDILDLLSRATIDPGELGEMAPRKGLDPKISNPYRSTKDTLRQALKALEEEQVLARGTERGETVYAPGANFQADAAVPPGPDGSRSWSR